MKNTFIIPFFLIITFIKTTQAQYINTTHFAASKIQQSILLVGLEEQDKAIINSFEGDQQDIESYKESIEGKNLALKNVIDSFWHFTHEVKFLPLKKAKELMKQEKEKYTLLQYGEIYGNETLHERSNISEHKPKMRGWIKKGESFEYNYYCRQYLENVRVSSIELHAPRKIFEVYLPVVHPSEADLMNAINHIQHSLAYLVTSPENTISKYQRESYTRADELQKLTLLIDQDQLRSNNVTELQKAYPYPVKVLTHKEIEKILKLKDSAYAVITISRFNPDQSVYMVTNAATGNLYFYSTSFTFDHGEKRGMYAISIRVKGLTSGILSEIAQAAK